MAGCMVFELDKKGDELATIISANEASLRRLIEVQVVEKKDLVRQLEELRSRKMTVMVAAERGGGSDVASMEQLIYQQQQEHIAHVRRLEEQIATTMRTLVQQQQEHTLHVRRLEGQLEDSERRHNETRSRLSETLTKLNQVSRSQNTLTLILENALKLGSSGGGAHICVDPYVPERRIEIIGGPDTGMPQTCYPDLPGKGIIVGGPDTVTPQTCYPDPPGKGIIIGGPDTGTPQTCYPDPPGKGIIVGGPDTVTPQTCYPNPTKGEVHVIGLPEPTQERKVIEVHVDGGSTHGEQLQVCPMEPNLSEVRVGGSHVHVEPQVITSTIEREVRVEREGHMHVQPGRIGGSEVHVGGGHIHVEPGRIGTSEVRIEREGHIHVEPGRIGGSEVHVGGGHIHVEPGRIGTSEVRVEREGHIHVEPGRIGGSEVHVGGGHIQVEPGRIGGSEVHVNRGHIHVEPGHIGSGEVYVSGGTGVSAGGHIQREVSLTRVEGGQSSVRGEVVFTHGSVQPGHIGSSEVHMSGGPGVSAGGHIDREVSLTRVEGGQSSVRGEVVFTHGSVQPEIMYQRQEQCSTQDRPDHKLQYYN